MTRSLVFAHGRLAPRAVLAFALLALAACKGEKGDPGAAGAAGATGATGQQGAPGPMGPASLTSTAVEGNGSNCATGGVRVDVGPDANGDGTLQSSEVDPLLTRYLCNGGEGPQGPAGATGPAGSIGPSGLNALTATTVEGNGLNCANGGLRVEVGVDANGDGTLQSGEVNAAATKYVCNGAQGIQGAQGDPGAPGAPGTAGADGFNTLTATALENPGGNCANGGTRVDFGVDTNRNGTLDGSEANLALRRFVCNGAVGTQGPPGAAGTLGAYGDGSAGALNITANTDWTSTPPSANLQFTTITVANGVSLAVPSGTILRATGNVTINGTIVVAQGTADSGRYNPQAGVAIAAASDPGAGVALRRLAAAQLVRLPHHGGGAGARGPNTSGSEGGGSFAIYAAGSITVAGSGSIMAQGNNGVNPQTAGVGIQGAGGGAGGVVVLMGKTAVSVAGTILANGGNGASGFDGNGLAAEGGGGGGGGGIVHLISSATPTTAGTINVNGGTAGANNGPSATVTAGGGGGGCGGNGGVGGSSISSVATAGSPGQSFSTVSPTPEALLL